MSYIIHIHEMLIQLHVSKDIYTISILLTNAQYVEKNRKIIFSVLRNYPNFRSLETVLYTPRVIKLKTIKR